MPRIPPSLFWKVHRISPDAARLLPACRDVPSALNELRWIREHVQSTPPATCDRLKGQRQIVTDLCRRRGRGEPLQYLLGSQPFGELDVLCRPGVLIPRPETEAYTVHLADRIGAGTLRALGTADELRARGGLRVLDLCTGTGCIALLLAARLARRGLAVRDVCGVDVAPRALRLARDNARRNRHRLGPCAPPRFQLLDLLAAGDDAAAAGLLAPRCDVVTCNPPYVSEAGFARETARSVRIFEPRAANVPQHRGAPAATHPEDVFYARVLDLAGRGAPHPPRVVFFEVGGMEQAKRVVAMALRHGPGVEVEIWRDLPDVTPAADEATSAVVDGASVPILGSGHGRGVLVQFHR